MARSYYYLFSTINMPSVSVDSEWRIVGYSGDFSPVHQRVARLSAENGHLSELLRDGDFEKINAYFERVALLKDLPFDLNDEPWVLEYEGPSAGEQLGRDWLISDSCTEKYWHISERDGRMEIEHRSHCAKEDCYLMNSRPLNRLDRDLKVIFRIRTGSKKNGIRDLSLVLGGTLGQDEMLCDRLGYTVCCGSVNNTQARIQRQVADLVWIKESLAPDRDYEVIVERTGGRIRRFLTDLLTGEQAPLLEVIDSDAVYDRSPYIGFTTFSGQARFYGVRVLSRRSMFKISRFRVPFNVEAGLRGLDGRLYKLRLGQKIIGLPRWTILFEDITEKHRTQEKIRFSEEKFRALFEMESDALFLISNVDGRILEVNAAAEEMYGYSRGELLQLKNVDLSGEPDQTRAATVGRLASIPVRWHRKKDGTVFPVEINARHFTWQGLPVHLAAIRGIEERINSQKALEEQRQFLRQVIDINPSIIFVLDENGRNILSNKALQNISGATQEELLGKFPDEFIVDPEHARRSRQMDRELIEGSRDRVELEEVIKDREEKTHRVYTVKVPQRDEYGKVTRIFGVSTDITAIRQGEEALRRSEKRFRELFEHSNDAIFIHDLDGRIMDVNRQACRMLGSTREELIKRFVQSLHNEEEKAAGRQNLKLLQTQGAVTFESRLERSDGSILDVEINAKLIDLETLTVQSVMRDITERKRAEEALRESERKYRALFDTSSEALSIIDVENNRYVEVNRTGEKLFGYTRREFLEQITPLDLNPNPAQSLEIMKEVLSSDRVHRYELIHIRKDRRLIPVEVYISSFTLEGRNYLLAQARDITERKRAEEALRESERKYRALFDTSSEALVIVDMDTRKITDANQAALNLYGYSREEFIGLTPADASKDKKWVENNYKRLIKEGAIQGLEVIHYRKGGIPVPVEVFGSMYQLEGRNYAMIQVRDITGRKEAERRLLESEAQSRAMLETIPDLMFRLDSRGVFLDCMGRTEDLIVPLDQILGKQAHDFLPGPVAEMTLEKIRQVLKTGGVQKFEYEIPSPAGSRSFEARMVAINSEEVLALERDITERKRAERQLAQAHAELDQIFNATNPIAVIGADGSVLRINRIWCEIFGQTIDEVAGKKCCDVWSGKRCGTKDCPLELIRGGLERIELEVEKKAVDGRIIPCILNVTPLRGPAGEFQGIVESFKDISELRQLEQERLRADKLESIGLLAGGIAHDFNNILTSVMGNASLAKMLVNPEDDIQEPLNAIESSSLRARELTMQLLTFSRGGQPVKQAVSLADLVKEAARFALSGSNVTWEFQFQPGLWPVEADPGQINQVLNNLIINADQAMPGGGVIRINMENQDVRENEVPGLAMGRFVRLSISDSGIGISQEHLARIFDPYFTTKQKGSGLGLATVYSIIRRHGGLITVESKVQKGATFRIWLPASLNEPKAPKENAPLRSGSGELVLVMDDDPGVRQVLEGMLTRLGYEVELAGDGEEAVKLYIERMARGRPFDAVVLDLTIPGGMGGREAVQKLLEIDPKVKAIVSSGYSNEQVLSDFRKYGFSGIIAKPYRLEELRAVMDQVLSGS